RVAEPGGEPLPVGAERERRDLVGRAERERLLARVERVDADLPVLPARGEPAPGRVEGERLDDVLVPAQRAALVRDAEAPDAHGPVAPPGGEPRAAPRPGDGEDARLGAAQ